jgi:hypothetical protein
MLSANVLAKAFGDFHELLPIEHFERSPLLAP